MQRWKSASLMKRILLQRSTGRSAVGCCPFSSASFCIKENAKITSVFVPTVEKQCSRHYSSTTTPTTTTTTTTTTAMDEVGISKEAMDFFRQGHFHEAAKLWQGMINRLEEKEEGEKEKQQTEYSPFLVTTLNNLANTYGEIGEMIKRRDILQRLVKINEVQFGKDHPHYCMALSNFASACGATNDYSTMKNVLNEAILLTKEKHGENHVKTARLELLLADAEEGLENFESQREILEKCLTLVKKHCGSKHYQTALTMSQLAKAYGRIGDKKKTMVILQESYDRDEVTSGRHPQLAIALNHLAIAEGYLGHFEEKKHLLEKALNNQKSTFGPDSKDQIATLNNLGVAYRECGEFDFSISVHQRALTIARRMFPKGHPQIGSSLFNCALAAQSMKKFSVMKRYAQEAVNEMEIMHQQTQIEEEPKALKNAKQLLVEDHKNCNAKRECTTTLGGNEAKGVRDDFKK